MTAAYILPPSSVWMQLSSMFFLCSGLFNDLLIIRCSLTLANTFLLLAASMGLPTFYQSFIPQNRVSLDTVIWSSLNLLMHGLSVIRIFYDERHIELTEDEEPLWRYLYRQSGLSKAKFKTFICPTLELVEYDAGQQIPLDDKFFIVLDGICHAEAEHFSISTTQRSIFVPIVSGQMFPLQHMCLEYMPTDNVFTRSWIRPVVAATKCKLYTFPSERLKEMSKYPATRDAWMSLLVATLTMIAERPFFQQPQQQQDKDAEDGFINPVSTSKDHSIEEDAEDGQYCCNNPLYCEKRNRLFNPLDPSEEPNPGSAGSTYVLKNPLGHVWQNMKQSFYVPWPIGKWPVGLRHHIPPPTDPNSDAILRRISTYKEELASASQSQSQEPQEKLPSSSSSLVSAPEKLSQHQQDEDKFENYGDKDEDIEQALQSGKNGFHITVSTK